MVCSFFGHKDAPQSIYPQIKGSIEQLIIQRNIYSFMVGNNGRFDSMVLKALREMKEKYPHICYNVVLAYIPSDKNEHELYDPSETLIPDGIEARPKRFAISYRNRWMVQKSNVVLCYITRSWGGAVQFVQYAQRQGKDIVNLSCQKEIGSI